MEAQAPYHAALRPAPENLFAPLAEWLDLLGFAVSTDTCGTARYVRGEWPWGLNAYLLEYSWEPGMGGACALWLRLPSGAVSTLITYHYTPTLASAQQLLLGCVRFEQAFRQARPDFFA